MNKYFIKDLKFKNFKCFKEFELDNIKNVNLISGKNNVGKTSLMEGIELFVSSQNSLNLILNVTKMIQRRQLNRRDERTFELDFIYKDNSNVELSINKNTMSINFIDESIHSKQKSLFEDENLFHDFELSLKFNIGNDEKIISINRLLNKNTFIHRERYDTKSSKVNFISSTTTDERDIANFYGEIVNLNKEGFLNESLQLFDANLVALKLVPQGREILLKISLKDRELPVLLSSLGEGMNRYIAILCAIWASKDGYLFIDEVENGIHYTNYDKLWKLIFNISKEANCQIFLTTHSLECITSFNRMNENDEGNYFELYRNKKTDLIVAKQRDYEQLSYGLSHKGSLRGE